MEGDQRTPASAAPPHGHRKLTGALATLLGGEVAGQEIIKFAWDSAIDVLNWFTGIPLEPMPDTVATSIFGLLAAASFYQTEEK